jgi:hypothetical protein
MVLQAQLLRIQVLIRVNNGIASAATQNKLLIRITMVLQPQVLRLQLTIRINNGIANAATQNRITNSHKQWY